LRPAPDALQVERTIVFQIGYTVPEYAGYEQRVRRFIPWIY